MTETPDYSQYKIIIVDSDNLFCNQLQSCLKDAGFQVEYERNAQASLKRIKNWKPHIVVSDYILHGLDYFDFASKLDAMPVKPRMVVVSSHYLDGKLISQLTNLSRVSLTLQKPIKSEDLLEKIIQFVPEIDVSEPTLKVADTDPDHDLNDIDLQKEVSRLQFEGKEFPRFISSMKALTTMAREQPHKPKFLREALEQSRRTIEETRRQELPQYEESIEKIVNWINEIIDQGSRPSLGIWDYVQDELQSLSEPRKRIGTATMPAEEPRELEYSEDTHDRLPRATGPAPWAPKAPARSPLSYQSGRAQKFLIIGSDPSEQLLNLGSRYNVSITFREELEQAQEACLSEFFDLVLLLIPSNFSGERARETVVATHEMLREIETYEETETYKETPLVILSALESLHTRIVTAHLDNSHWISWSGMRKNDSEFLALKALAGQPITRPAVLIIDSDISDSEELLRELSRRCSRVDALHDPNTVIKVIEENKPDMILISERTGDLSGFDLARAIRSCLSFKSITLILEVGSVNESALKGAFRAGVDGVICKSESIESRAESMLTICNRSLMSRIFSEDTSEKSLEVPAAIREALEKDLKRATEEQLPLTICLVDLKEDDLTCDDFSHMWNSKQKEITTKNTSSVHFLDRTQLLISLVGLRKSAIAILLEEMLDADQMREDNTGDAWQFRCRCYPDDALSLSDLLRFF